MRIHPRLAAAVALLSVCISRGHACSCIQPPPLDHRFFNSGHVFSATLISVSAPYNVSGMLEHTATAVVTEKFKGEIADTVAVTSGTSSAACGIEFEPGQQWVLFPSMLDDGTFQTSLCDHNILLDGADRDSIPELLRTLRKGIPSQARTVAVAGSAHAVQVRDDRAFVSSDSGLTVVDISDPYNPHVTAFTPLRGQGNELVLYYDYLYVTGDAQKAFHVVDISSPDEPVFKNSLGEKFGLVSGIDCDLSGNLLGVAATAGLVLYDLSDPLNPESLSTYFPYDAAYVRDTTGRLNPSLADRIFIFEDSSIAWLSVDTGACITGSLNYPIAGYIEAKTEDVCLDGNRAYILYFSNGTCGDALRIKTIDITDPSAPVCIDSIRLYGYAVGCALGLDGGRLYAVHEAGINIFDPQKLSHELPLFTPVDFNTYWFLGTRYPGTGEDIVVKGAAAFMACASEGLRMIDVADPGAPKLIGAFDLPGDSAGRVLGVAVDERGVICMAYEQSGLVVAAGYELPSSTGVAGFIPSKGRQSIRTPVSATRRNGTGLLLFGPNGQRLPPVPRRRSSGNVLEKTGPRITARIQAR
jgi:hypothetical protein